MEATVDTVKIMITFLQLNITCIQYLNRPDHAAHIGIGIAFQMYSPADKGTKML